MILRMFWSFIAIFFPWVILLLDDNPGGALIALIMQATIIGWVPASIWALRIVQEGERKPSPTNEDKKQQQQEKQETQINK